MPPSDSDVPARRHGSQVHALRAGIVVACFVIAVIVLLGPASRLTASSPPGSTSITTTTLKPKPVDKAQTSVQVANGTPSPHLAGHYTQVLQLQGWDVQPALDSSTHPSTTIVYFAPNQQAAAKLVAADLGLNPKTSVRARTADTGAANQASMDVIVILGPDLET